MARKESDPNFAARSTFMSRFERLLRMRRDYGKDLNPLGVHLVNQAINATYTDCIDFGASTESLSAISDKYVTNENLPVYQAPAEPSLVADKPNSENPIILKSATESANIAELSIHFQSRLARLARLKQINIDDLNPLGLRLVDRAINAAFRDCVDFGVNREDAIGIVRGYLKDFSPQDSDKK